jgi:glycosyltransferase involved in cell wall biosynthesis
MSEHSPGLSVVMIVKNAEQYLSTVLRSLRRVADEIVVVDTGSTDSSRKIANKYDCRIFDFTWCDDFSKAKNYAISQARFDWVMNVDADEVIFESDAKDVLAGALRRNSFPAYVVWQDNLKDDGRVEPVKVLRLFRNDPRIRFTNPVHESIGESLHTNWPGYVPPVLDIHLRHYGYLSPNRRGKHDRNNVLLRKWVTDEPDNVYANYKLGGTLAEMGNMGEALTYLDRAFTLFAGNRDRNTYPFLPAFVNLYCDLLVAKGLEAKAERCRQIAGGWS